MPPPSFRNTSSAETRSSRARKEPQISDKRTRSLRADQSAEFRNDENPFSNSPYRPRISDAPSLLDDTSKWLASDAEQNCWSADTAAPAEDWTHVDLPVNADEGQVMLDLNAEPCDPGQIQVVRNRVDQALTSPPFWLLLPESTPRNPDPKLGGSKPAGIYDTILHMSDLQSHLNRRRHDIPWRYTIWQARWAADPQVYGPSATEFRKSPAMQRIVNKIAHFNELIEAWNESAGLFERVSIQGKKNSELKAEVHKLEMVKAITDHCRSVDSEKLQKQEKKIEELQKDLNRSESCFDEAASLFNPSDNDHREQRDEIAALRTELQNTRRERDQVQKSFDRLVGDMTRSLNEVKQGQGGEGW